MKRALRRLHAAASAKTDPLAGRDAPLKPAILLAEVERAVQVLGSEAAGEILRRLMPFVRGAQARANRLPERQGRENPRQLISFITTAPGSNRLEGYRAVPGPRVPYTRFG
jgi:hypothetical protein